MPCAEKQSQCASYSTKCDGHRYGTLTASWMYGLSCPLRKFKTPELHWVTSRGLCLALAWVRRATICQRRESQTNNWQSSGSIRVAPNNMSQLWASRFGTIVRFSASLRTPELRLPGGSKKWNAQFWTLILLWCRVNHGTLRWIFFSNPPREAVEWDRAATTVALFPAAQVHVRSAASVPFTSPYVSVNLTSRLRMFAHMNFNTVGLSGGRCDGLETPLPRSPPRESWPQQA